MLTLNLFTQTIPYVAFSESADYCILVRGSVQDKAKIDRAYFCKTKHSSLRLIV